MYWDLRLAPWSVCYTGGQTSPLFEQMSSVSKAFHSLKLEGLGLVPRAVRCKNENIILNMPKCQILARFLSHITWIVLYIYLLWSYVKSTLILQCSVPLYMWVVCVRRLCIRMYVCMHAREFMDMCMNSNAGVRALRDIHRWRLWHKWQQKYTPVRELFSWGLSSSFRFSPEPFCHHAGLAAASM